MRRTFQNTFLLDDIVACQLRYGCDITVAAGHVEGFGQSELPALH